MRVALLSDIHGNVVALDAVLADLVDRGPFDHIVVAGDLAWSGPRPAAVVDRVRALKATVIQGNTDAFFGFGIGETPEGKDSDRFTAQLAWMQSELGPERSAYLAGLPFQHRISPAPGHDLLVVHANPKDMDQALLPGMSDEALDVWLLDSVTRQPWAALAYGHLHVPHQRRWRHRLLVNVASVGLPMDGDPRAVWAILTWDGAGWHAEHRRVFYNTQVVAHEMRKCGMPRGKHFADRLMTAGYSGGDLPARSLAVAD